MAEVRDAAAGGAAALRLPPVGFWSYSRQDDELSDGKLSKLRRLLVAEIQQQYGRDPVQLFQDRSTIPHGAEWEQEIRRSIDEATFFIPIVTPNFIQSEWCSAELLMFLEREQRLQESYDGVPRRSRIFPIRFIDISGVDPHDQRVLAALEQRQGFDFTGLRYRNLQDDAVQQALGEFATSIRRALHIKVRPAGTKDRAQAATVPPAPEAVPSAAAAVAEPPRPTYQAAAGVAAPTAAPDRPAAPAQAVASRVPGDGRRAGQVSLWAGLGLLGAVVALGTYLLLDGSDDPSGPRVEVAGSAPPVAPSAAGAPSAPSTAPSGQWDRWKAQLRAAPAEAEPEPAPPPPPPANASADPAAAAAQSREACSRLYDAADAGSPATEAANLRRFLTRCPSASDRRPAERRLAEIAGYRRAIERVLAEDRRGGATSAQAVFARVRGIDTSGTPAEFRRAYQNHVAAWRDRAEVDRMAPGPQREARTGRVDLRVRSTYENAVAIASRYGAR